MRQAGSGSPVAWQTMHCAAESSPRDAMRWCVMRRQSAHQSGHVLSFHSRLSRMVTLAPSGLGIRRRRSRYRSGLRGMHPHSLACRMCSGSEKLPPMYWKSHFGYGMTTTIPAWLPDVFTPCELRFHECQVCMDFGDFSALMVYATIVVCASVSQRLDCGGKGGEGPVRLPRPPENADGLGDEDSHDGEEVTCRMHSSHHFSHPESLAHEICDVGNVGCRTPGIHHLNR